VEISEPTTADCNSKRPWTHTKLWRSAFFLVGSLVGIVVGIAVLTVLAHPAGATTLPDPAALPGVQSVSGSVPLAGVEGSTASLVPVTETTMSNVSSLPSNTVHQIPALAVPAVVRPLVTGAGALALPLAGAVPAILPTSGQGTTPVSGGSGSAADAHAGNAGAFAIDRSGVAPAAGATAAVPLRTPIVPSPVPTPPTPSPISPLAMSDASSYSSPVQGISPLGLLPLSSSLLAALAVAGVLMAREKKLPLLLDSRCSPPG
jgi:hypothetical protein